MFATTKQHLERNKDTLEASEQMMWYTKKDNKLHRFDIPKLRQLSRTPEFCNKVEESELDTILAILLTQNEVNLEEKVDIIASISNIVLINRQLHLSYFIPKYAKTLFIFCDKFIRQLDPSNFKSLIPIYRILFLTLYGGLEEINNDVIENVFNLLFQGFQKSMIIIDQEINNEFFQLNLIEILKCLYTLHHKYHHGLNLVQDEEFSDSCLNIINISFKHMTINPLNKNFQLLIKNSFGFLLILFGEREETKSHELYSGPLNIYMEFYRNVKVQLQESLYRLGKSESHEKDEINALIINYLVVLNHMSKLLITDIEQKITDDEKVSIQGRKDEEKFELLLKELLNIVSPSEVSSTNYNELMKLIASPLFSNLTEPQGFSGIQQASHIKELIVNLLYNSSYNKIKKLHQLKFLELVGYLNADSFLNKNQINLDPTINLTQFQEPTCKYLDIKTYEEIKSYVNLPPANTSTSAAQPEELTEEEKEREAEKLFVLFERMENLGTFENFENPVKKWQREGKFEELED